MQTLFGTRSNHYFSKLFIFPTFPQFLDENSALGSIEIFYVDKKAVENLNIYCPPPPFYLV